MSSNRPDQLPVLLLIDDNRDTAVTAGRLLAGNGFRVEVARGGDAGIEKALALVPDVIVTDLVMPTTSGIAVVERLRRSPRTRAIPIVVYTAVSDVSVLARLRRLGVSLFAIKPCIPLAIGEQIRLFLGHDGEQPSPLCVITGYGETLEDLEAQIREAENLPDPMVPG